MMDAAITKPTELTWSAKGRLSTELGPWHCAVTKRWIVSSELVQRVTFPPQQSSTPTPIAKKTVQGYNRSPLIHLHDDS